MSGSQLQANISQLVSGWKGDPDALKDQVEFLIAKDRAAQLGVGSYVPPLAAAPVVVSTPLSSRSGRILKPSKPYSPVYIAPTPMSRPTPPAQPQQQQFARASSSLNPNTYRPPKPVPLSSSHVPVPPLSRIAEARYQALYTTYPARMRLGTSSLMQPNYLAASGTGTNTPGAADRKRGRLAVNYAEMEGLEDSEDDSNDAEGRAARRAAAAAGPGGMVPKRALGVQGPGDKAVWGDGKSYLGVPPPGNLVSVQLAKVTRHGAFSEDQLEEQALEAAILVPIQIDIDVDTFKIRDSFVWNVNERLITPDAFARIFCDDLDIPVTWAAEVAKQIVTQCEEQTGIVEIPVRSDADELNDVEKDLRVILNLDVQIGTLHLVDRIEWDLSSCLTPELFSTLLVRDLSLSSSAAPLIAHALHEEIMKHKKTCLEMGLVGEDVVEGAYTGNKKRGPRVLEGVWREWNESLNYGPRVEVLSLDEMDKMEADRERLIRRAKRDRLTSTGRRRR